MDLINISSFFKFFIKNDIHDSVLKYYFYFYQTTLHIHKLKKNEETSNSIRDYENESNRAS